MDISYYRGKRVTIMGLGVYEDGSGISAARFFASAGARITVTDLKSRADLAQQIRRLGPAARRMKFVLGRHDERDFISADIVVRNPAVPAASPYLALARQRGVSIENDITLLYKLVDRKRIIGVTGTRGKSTTATLVYEMIKRHDSRAVLGGNITTSPLAQLASIRRGGPIVLELSSWLLEECGQQRLSPHVAVVTNIYPDHLNSYHDIDDYAAAKAHIWRWQNAQDYTILNYDNAYTRTMGRAVPAQRWWVSQRSVGTHNGCFVRGDAVWCRDGGQTRKVFRTAELKILGQHNVANATAAAAAAYCAGAPLSDIARAARSFRGVPFRQELRRTIGGVAYYNDTTSTTPEALIAALTALGGADRKIVLIAGGRDKGLMIDHVLPAVRRSVKALILLPGSGTDQLVALLEAKRIRVPLTRVSTLADAVGIARAQAERGDRVVFSPGFTSFGMFVNEFDRGQQFNHYVAAL